MTNADDLTLRNDVTGALIAGGHWHGGGNEEICTTITHLCKAANERDTLRAQNAALEAELAKVREVASENFKYLKDRVSALHDKNAALISLLKQALAVHVKSDCRNAVHPSRKFCEMCGLNSPQYLHTQDCLMEKIEAAIAAAEGGAE